MDLREFIAQFQDHLAPQVDTYEQTIYLYVFRHSRLIGLDQVTLGFKSARRHMARDAGEKGNGMSLNTVYSKLARSDPRAASISCEPRTQDAS